MILLLALACTANLPFTAQVAPNPDDPLGALVSVHARQDLSVQVLRSSPDEAPSLGPPVALAAGEDQTLVVRGLLADSDWQLQVQASDGSRSWEGEPADLHTEPLPADWPGCTVTVPDDSEQFGADAVVCSNGLLTDTGTGVYYCVDRQGRPRWSLQHPAGVILRVLTPLPDGGFAGVGLDDSGLALFSASGTLTGWFPPSWFTGQTRFQHDFIDGHEVLLIDQGPWAGALAIMTATWDTIGEGDSAEDRLAYGLIVFDPGAHQVLWDWSAHGELGDDQPIDPKLPYDRLGASASDPTQYMHSNALLYRTAPDGVGELWMSVRHQDWIIAIDTETDAVRWRLGRQGDFQFVDDLDAADPVVQDDSQWFYAQHGPSFHGDDGDRIGLFLFDNGKGRVDSDGLSADEVDYSRALELHLDTTGMRASIGWSHGSPYPADPEWMYAAGGGDVDLLPGGDQLQVLKGWDATFVQHLSYPQGEELWRWSCPDGEDDTEQYRARYALDLADW